eukprot:CAMPEP_0194730792 /NCGR_PEP_ID=MMETSP0296-20130528/54371_1 /TAXON_ID=39354 /ORGANISM="Heterosigma akashiwo, Strain CCMP2393" /LENGTH=116 /DNA_ID=CAMNT_0039638009 /DNA_START=319 /DNA_END=666 /DNA_ORIENTATION=+
MKVAQLSPALRRFLLGFWWHNENISRKHQRQGADRAWWSLAEQDRRRGRAQPEVVHGAARARVLQEQLDAAEEVARRVRRLRPVRPARRGREGDVEHPGVRLRQQVGPHQEAVLGG